MDKPIHNQSTDAELVRKPAFNVTVPFEKITNVQMNMVMADSLTNFILDFDDIDVEMYALAETLRDPGGWYRQKSETAFSVAFFGGIVSIQLNKPMVDMLVDWITDTDGEIEPEITAFCCALRDPHGTIIIREQEELIEKFPTHTLTREELVKKFPTHVLATELKRRRDQQNPNQRQYNRPQNGYKKPDKYKKTNTDHEKARY